MTKRKEEIQTAVILAAGMGTRLKGMIGDQPKGLMKIGEKEIIRESLERILKGGIAKIVMVTGYQQEKYRQALKDEFPLIEYVQNPDYSTTGSMHSLFLAREKIGSDFLLLESDLLYEDRCISSLVEIEEKDVVLLSGSTNSGDEVYVHGDHGKIKLISKERNNSIPVQGELVGISKISLTLLETMCGYYQREISFSTDFHYEDCLSDLSRNHSINYHKIDDIVWTEIDDLFHYERAKKDIYPRIQNNLETKEDR